MLTFDKLTSRDLIASYVRLIDLDTKEEVKLSFNEEGNLHEFQIFSDRNYMLIAEKEDYFPDTLSFSTFDYDKSQKITKKMYLSTDKMLVDVFTFTKIGKFPLEGTTVTITDMDDPEAKPIVKINPLGNDFFFLLDRGKRYRIIGTKDGYTDAVDIIDTRPYDKSGLITKELFLDKFTLPDLLPIALYFENDLPDPRSKNTITTTKYSDLVGDYIRAQSEYIEKFALPLNGEAKMNAIEDINDFFGSKVEGNYNRFNEFLKYLMLELEAGNKVELVLKGFASPRADAKYNLALGQRRVHSIRNDMIYKYPSLEQYFKSKQIIITDISFGKELAPKDVVADLSDRRNSIYSIKAATERRVEILRANRN